MRARSFLAAVIAFLGLVLPVGHAQAANLLVVPDDYPTIQGAIDAAAPGDTVGIRQGVYPEDLWIEHYMTITGLEQNRRDVVVQGSIGIFDFLAPTVVTLHNLTLRGDLLAHESADVQTGRLEVKGRIIVEQFARVSFRASNFEASSVDEETWGPENAPIQVRGGDLYVVGARLNGGGMPFMIYNVGFMIMNFSTYFDCGAVVFNRGGYVQYGEENQLENVSAPYFNKCGMIEDSCGGGSFVPFPCD